MTTSGKQKTDIITTENEVALDRYREFLEFRAKAPSTVDNYVSMVRRILRMLGRDYDPDADPEETEALILDLMEGYSQSSRNQYIWA